MIFEYPTSIRFQDVDAAGIIFFARAFDLFNDAWIACLEAHGVSLPRVLEERRWGAPLVHAEADYRSPMRFGDRVRVVIESVIPGETSATIRFRIRSESEPERTLSEGKTVHAFIDLATFRPRAVPDELRSAFSQDDRPGDRTGGGPTDR